MKGNRISSRIRSKIIAVAIVCLFSMNTVTWTLPQGEVLPSRYTLQAQSIFKPILDEAGREHATQIRIEMAMILAIVLKNSDKPFQDINALLDEWYSDDPNLRTMFGEKRRRLLNVTSNPATNRDSVKVEVELFQNGPVRKKFWIKMNSKSMDGIQKDESKLKIRTVNPYAFGRDSPDEPIRTEDSTSASDEALPIDVDVKVERKGLVLEPVDKDGKADLNAGVLKYKNGTRLLFMRLVDRTDNPIPEIPWMCASKIGLYIHDPEAEKVVCVDPDMLRADDKDLISGDKDIMFLEDARVREEGGVIYADLIVIKPIIKGGKKEIAYYPAVTTHDAEEFRKKVREGRTDWQWTPLKRLITDGPCAGGNIKNFARLGHVKENGGSKTWQALYRPEKQANSTIRLAKLDLSEADPARPLEGPWKDAGEFMSVDNPENEGYVGPSVLVSGTDEIAEIPYKFMIYHRANQRTPETKYYDLRLLVIDKDNVRRYVKVPLMKPEFEELHEMAGWVPGAIYSTGAILKGYDIEKGEYVFDVYYSGSDTAVLMATVTVHIKDKTTRTKLPTSDKKAEAVTERKKRRTKKRIKHTRNESLQVLSGREGVKKYLIESMSKDKAIPVDIPIDLSLITKKDLQGNVETWAYQILSCLELENVNFIFESPDVSAGVTLLQVLKDNLKNAPAKAQVLAILKEQIRAKAAQCGMDVDVERLFKERINVERRRNAVEIPIISKAYLEWLRDPKTKSQGLKENQYPVAMDGATWVRGEGAALRNFDAALTIGLSKAALVMAKRRDGQKNLDDEKELPQLRKELCEKLQGLYEVFRTDVKLTEKTLDYMIASDPAVRLNLAISLALPPLTRMAIESLQDLHESIHRVLSAA
jgi:hypothetical protein